MYMGWCDGVQACDGNMVCATCSAPRAETPVLWAGILDAPRVRVTG